MKIITKKEVVNQSVSRWVKQYENYVDRGDRFDKKPITEKLLNLSKPYCEKEINQIIGNKSWTSLTCDECSDDVAKGVVFDVSGGEYSFSICESCLFDYLERLRRR